jgi:hypothetical protein
MSINNNQPTHTFEDAFESISVDASTHNATSRVRDPTEGLEEASRLRRIQEEADKDFNARRMYEDKEFNAGRIYEDTTTQNLPFRRRLSVEIDLNQGYTSATGRQLYANRLAA